MKFGYLLMLFFLNYSVWGEDAEKIYAVMITGKDLYHRPFAELAIQSFHEQTYPNKELVIINDGEYSLKEYESDSVKEIRLDKKYNLGALRNIGLSFIPENQVWIQWDDDDWRHPDLIAKQYEIMIKNSADLCSLESQVRYAFGKNTAWLSSGGVAESTIMCRKKEGVLYDSESKKGEDTYFYLKYIGLYKSVFFKNPSHYYLRFIHGHNTWDENHFELSKKCQDEWKINSEEAAYLRSILKRYHEALSSLSLLTSDKHKF